MHLCYRCFLREGYDSRDWDKIHVDASTRKACELCGLMGYYVRDVKQEKNEEVVSADRRSVVPEVDGESPS
jgi:hypothetical protein